MNLPNKITCVRMALVPLFVVLFYMPSPVGRMLALVVFIVASLTDLADGYIARKYHLITDFGKFMDPLADKLLVCSALLCLVGNGEVPAWVALIIIAREFIISGFRLVAADQGKVIAAGWWGKCKTVVQMIWIIVVLLQQPAFRTLERILMVASVILTIVSLVDYIFQNRSVLSSDK